MRTQLWLVLSLVGLGCSFDAPSVPGGSGGTMGSDAAVPPDAPVNLPDSIDTRDNDMDGVINANDNCIAIENPQQEDLDNDDEGDACDDDDDGDTIADTDDNCPTVANSDQVNTDAAPDGGDLCDNDDDNDSFTDDVDNCSVIANLGQEDEDTDGVGNVCDNCPGTANPNQEDALDSGDGVGDACDPRPNDPGDSLLFFDGFDNPDSLNSWTEAQGFFTDPSGDIPYKNGTWKIENGHLKVDREGDEDPLLLFYSGSSGPFSNIAVSAGLTVDEIIDNDFSPFPYIGLVTAYTNVGTATDSGHACWWQKTASTANRIRVKVLDSDRTSATSANITNLDLVQDGSYVLSSAQNTQSGGSRTVCQASAPDGSAVGYYSGNFNMSAESGTFGITVRKAGMSVAYIVVYSLGGTPSCSPATSVDSRCL